MIETCKKIWINTPHTTGKMKIICIIADRFAISSKRFPTKIALHCTALQYTASAHHTPQNSTTLH
jgi:hypothetical protein